MTAPADAAARLAWQQQANATVGLLLDASVEHGLPPLSWVVGGLRELSGWVIGRDVPAAEHQAAFDAWVAYLGVTPSERTLCSGVVWTSAEFVVGGVEGKICAEFAPPGGPKPRCS